VLHVLPALREQLTRRLPDVAPRSHPRMLTEEPAVGAVRLAVAEAHGGARLPQYV
jgi:hypothetical protein